MITIKDLCMQFQNETAIRYRGFTFENGRSYVLLGASGCGKSTLLNMIAGILTPTGGSVMIDDFVISAAPQKQRDQYRIRNIGYIFQDFKLIAEMTVQDNIEILRLEHIDVSRMDEMLDMLGILPLKKRKITRLSGGEKQRVAIARALIKRPQLLLADEPTGNLNYEIGSAIIDEMLAAAGGKTLIAVTHDDRLANRFDEVIRMEDLICGGERHA